MAEFPVQRKVPPIWAWLLGVMGVMIVVAILLWPRASYTLPSGAAVTSDGTAERSAGGVAETNGITELSALVNPSKPDMLAGKYVHLTNTLVLVSNGGGRTFWVGTDPSHQVLVVLNESPTSSLPFRGGQYDIKPGETVSIKGEVMKFPGFQRARKEWNVNPNLKSEFDRQKIYIYANEVEATAGPPASH